MEKKTVCIDASKRETHHGGAGFKKLFRRLKASYKVTNNKEDFGILKTVDVLVIACPRDRFSSDELAELRGFVEDGGSLLVASCEGGEATLGSNLNELLAPYSIMAQSDCVLRAAFYKYLHPKEVFVSHGVLLPEIVEQKEKLSKKAAKPKSFETLKGGGLDFVYPRGSTLSVQRPARAVLSSGAVSYPMNRAICAAWEGNSTKRPRVVAVGSVEMLSDEWLEKEENALVCDMIFKWLARDKDCPSLVGPHHLKDEDEQKKDDVIESFQLNGDTHYADALGSDTYQRVPDIASLASRLRPCLQEHDELPRDFTKLFVDKLFGYDTYMIPEVIAMYDVLKVKHETLSLIPPTFEAPLPPLQPATFPPALREPPNPPLDQFDLDEHFASPRERLAQLTNKCLPNGRADVETDDLDYYVREAGEICGAVSRMDNMGKPHHTAKHILAFVLAELVSFKMVNPNEPPTHVKDAADVIANNEPVKRKQLATLDRDELARPVSRGGPLLRDNAEPKDEAKGAAPAAKLVDVMTFDDIDDTADSK